MSQVTPVKTYHHGQTPAAWAGVILSGIGFILGALGAMLGPNWTLIWVGAVLLLVSLVVATVLRRLGYGQ